MKTFAEAPAVAPEEENPLDGIPLLNLTPKGAPPARLTKASVARRIFQSYYDADRLRAIQRAEMQNLLDGDPPFNQAELDAAGQFDTTNITFHGTEQQLERALAPLYRLVSNTEVLMSVSTTYGPEEDRPSFNTILAEELTRTIRDTETHSFQTKRLLHKSVGEGLGIIHWPDDLDFRYRSSGFGHFYFADQSDACESDQECICSLEEYTITRLWTAIRNKEVAEKNGWNFDVAKNAILKAEAKGVDATDWERMMEELKNNDIGASIQPKISLISIWVKEFDGTVSLYLTTKDDQGTEEFLYCSRGKYQSMRQALVLFPHGLGTNTKLHSIKGELYKIYPFERQRDRSLCRMIDISEVASSLMVKAGDEGTMSDIGLQYIGPLAVIPEGCEFIPNTAPDLTQSVMPVLNEMERLRNDRVAGYSSDNVFDGDQRKTKFELSAKLDQSASLSDSQIDFFYGPYDRVMQETVRRMSRKDYVAEDPGGREIKEMHARLMKRGVPLEALFMIDIMATKTIRAIGAGSPAAKTQSLARINELRPRMDDVGIANLDWDQAVDAVGPNAARYLTKDGVKRTTADTNIAILENNDLLEGKEIPVQSSDKHLAHAREHLAPLMEGFQAEQAGQVPIEEIGPRMAPLYNHAADHIDRVSGDPTVEAEAAEMRQIMQKVGEIVSNGLKAAEAKQQEADAEGEQEQGGDPSMLIEVEKHREQMRMRQETHQLDMQMREEEAAQKRALADADAAAKMMREARKPAKK